MYQLNNRIVEVDKKVDLMIKIREILLCAGISESARICSKLSESKT